MIWKKITLIKKKKKNKIINEIRINITIYVFYISYSLVPQEFNLNLEVLVIR